ncbi:MAG TPA: asparagine--tRNA ligase [Oligoflexia bacterium]|nr:asparagine--tRNA ligase [Oligoflexia bacterium]HMP27000.1 asparagine--tRNA ligase [Oligoflexia bacterium]
MNRLKVLDTLKHGIKLGEYLVQGWIRTHRQSKQVVFIELVDGGSVRGLQLVIDPQLEDYKQISSKLTTGAAIETVGELRESPAKGQLYEVYVSSLRLIGEADPEIYPLQKKGHTLEFLREILHLRSRSNTFGAIFRLRAKLAQAVHRFFDERGFYYVHTPIISTSDCEGAGEMFNVTTLNLKELPLVDGEIDYTQDFFKERAGLTVSGQLEAEALAMGLGKVYTFGPTFRAENSNTTRHLSEFWMIEPEMAFYNLEDNMNLARDFICYLIETALIGCRDDLDFLAGREWAPRDLFEALERVAKADFEVLDYSEAIKILESSGEVFQYPVKWGIDLQTEHERYITDVYVKGPVFVVNYPKGIKAFYMRQNEDGRTVRAMDLLVPRLGEIIGGSQREERHDHLLTRIRELALSEDIYWWYLDLRRFGSVPHSGFGLGFERLLMYVSGMQNIRDVIPFPRYPEFAKF